jgi:phenylacetate-CoA ligase
MTPLLSAFRRAAAEVAAYRRLLDEHRIDPADIVDLETFTRHCPVLTKANTFDRFPIDQLCAEGALGDLAGVFTSSGHGGRFSFGLSTRQQQAGGLAIIDGALDQAFKVSSRRTLVINCLPMGVGLASTLATVANTSVREDMATALVTSFGPYYEQIIIVSDPLFLKRLLDYAAERRVDWRKYRLGVILGEEMVGEHFRSYVARRLGLDKGERGSIISSFGVGELGLHLCYETPATIAVRRAAFRNASLSRVLFGDCTMLPIVMTYNAERTLIEAVDRDTDGYGRMTVSMLDSTTPIPLLRYQTGDVVRLLDSVCVGRELARRGIELPGPLPEALVAIAGREKERLTDRTHVAAYKDALWFDDGVADRLTGAFRLHSLEGGFLVVHVQLVRGEEGGSDLEDRLRTALGIAPSAGKVVACRYEAFPFGMSLDYERKFAYYVPGESPVAAV